MRQMIVFWVIILMALVSCKKDDPTPVDPVKPCVGANCPDNGNGNGNGSGTKPDTTGGGQVIPDSLKAFTGSLTKNILGMANLVRRELKFTKAQVPDELEFKVIDGQLLSPAVTTAAQIATDDIIVDLYKLKWVNFKIPGDPILGGGRPRYVAVADQKSLPTLKQAGFKTLAWVISDYHDIRVIPAQRRAGIMLVALKEGYDPAVPLLGHYQIALFHVKE